MAKQPDVNVPLDEWTETVKPGDIAKALHEHHDARGVIVTQSETSSGVLNDVKAIAEITA